MAKTFLLVNSSRNAVHDVRIYCVSLIRTINAAFTSCRLVSRNINM